MKKISKTIVFFGSGPVAAKSLELLHEHFVIEAVVTKPKPAHHKGDFPVISSANKLDLPTILVSSKHELDEVITAKTIKSDIGILIDFGIIVSQKAINYFPLGIVNSHFSLLPQLRGADPISFSILSGQNQTGVSLMLLVEAMDEGPILAQSPYELEAQITTPKLTQDLTELSAQMLVEIIPQYITGNIRPVLQGQSMYGPTIPTYSRKLTKQDGIIDWEKSATKIEREIRAFLGWPSSRTTLLNKEVIITQATVVRQSGKPGVVQYSKKQLIVHCGEDSLSILRLKPSGKKEMPVQAFLAGIHQD